MRFGIGVFPAGRANEAIRWARLADDIGYDAVWVGDSHLIWRELYILLGAMAATTSKVQLGPCVTNTSTRHLSVTAAAIATLHDLSDGRSRLGVGVGDSAVKNLGKKSSSLTFLEESINNFRRLFRGEKFVVDEYPIQLDRASTGEIPIYIAAGAPKMQKLAGRIADGVVLGYGPDMVQGIARVREGEASAGRREGEVQVLLWTPCSVARDASEAFEAVKPQVARRLLSAATRGALSEDEMELTAPLRKAYDFRHHMGPEHSSLVPDQLVEYYAIAGTPENVRTKIEVLRSIKDIHEIAIIPWANNREEVIRTFGEEVVKSLRQF